MNIFNQKIISVLERENKALSIQEIMDRLGDQKSKRTVQRRLNELLLSENVSKIGNARGTAYQVVEESIFLEKPYWDSMEEKDLVMEEKARYHKRPSNDYSKIIALSEESLDILSYLKKDRTGNKRLSYQPSLLQNYVPNQSFYLERNVRERLRRIGQPEDIEKAAGTYAREIYNRLLIDLSFSSSSLEGNTYTLLETAKLVQKGEEGEGKSVFETQMILNHKTAIEMLIEDADEIDFNSFTILNLHNLLSENLLKDPLASGNLRKIAVGISGSSYIPLSDYLKVKDYFDEILRKCSEIRDPFEQSFFILVHLPYLQPFEDVNKRVARIASNIPFVKNNLCPLTFLDLPPRAFIDALLAIYELQRFELLQDVFIWAYERSTQQYIEAKKELVEPNPVRLRYRKEIHEMVGKVIREMIFPYKKRVFQFADDYIDEASQETFAYMVEEDVKRLHEGALVRNKIKLSEFRKWKEMLEKKLKF